MLCLIHKIIMSIGSTLLRFQQNLQNVTKQAEFCSGGRHVVYKFLTLFDDVGRTCCALFLPARGPLKHVATKNNMESYTRFSDEISRARRSNYR
jgi:hypothetical protein